MKTPQAPPVFEAPRIDRHPPSTMIKKEAEHVAHELQSGDPDGWTYTPVPCNEPPLYVVEIRDEEGEFVAFY